MELVCLNSDIQRIFSHLKVIKNMHRFGRYDREPSGVATERWESKMVPDIYIYATESCCRGFSYLFPSTQLLPSPPGWLPFWLMKIHSTCLTSSRVFLPYTSLSNPILFFLPNLLNHTLLNSQSSVLLLVYFLPFQAEFHRVLFQNDFSPFFFSSRIFSF